MQCQCVSMRQWVTYMYLGFHLIGRDRLKVLGAPGIKPLLRPYVHTAFHESTTSPTRKKLSCYNTNQQLLNDHDDRAVVDNL